MPDYKAMYLKLYHANEQALNLLAEAHRECSEIYFLSQQPEKPQKPQTPAIGKEERRG